MLDNAANDHIETDKKSCPTREAAAANTAAREEERQHIAREVHDELGQILAVLRMNVSLLRIQFGGGNPQLMEKIQDLTELTDQAIQGVRNVAVKLRPPVLDKGIVYAIGWLSTEFARRTSTPCTVDADTTHLDLGETCSLTVFRVVQESLTNVARHAQAGHVRISLALLGNCVRVEVRDNGRGFDPIAQPEKRPFGLAGMRERVIAAGGDFGVVSAPGRGTAISACIPIVSISAMS